MSLAEAIAARDRRRRRLLDEARRAAAALRAHGADSVWVFGSVARGHDVVASSDLDLAAVLPIAEGSRMAEARRLMEAVPSAEPIDLLVFRPDEWDEARRHPPFTEAIPVLR